MPESSPSPERLSEVSRLAGELADQILLESLLGPPSVAKVSALGEAVHLLEDCHQPIPDLVTEVLGRLQAEAAAAKGDASADAEIQPGRGSRFIPRFLRSRRSP